MSKSGHFRPCTVIKRGMNTQLKNRLGAPHVKHVLEQFCASAMTADSACNSLGICRSNLYKLRTSYLRAKAEGCLTDWSPGISGGNRAPEWPQEVESFIVKALSAGYNYSFVASEAERQFGRRMDRSQVRLWAIKKGHTSPLKPPRLPAHLRRWQRSFVGELWQLDASAHRWFGEEAPLMPLLDMIDDASRLQVGCSLYHREILPAYLTFLRQAFEAYGLPLEIYVDRASIFESTTEKALTRLGQRLKFYEVSLVYANSPQAKGKIERIHQVWQDRLPPYFSLNDITIDTPIETINQHIKALYEHRNMHEKHREIKMTPKAAWDTALAEGRSRLRTVPKEPWWPYVWSLRHKVEVGQRGYVCFQNERYPTSAQAGEKAFLYLHDNASVSILKNEPEKGEMPVVIFTNRRR